MRRWLLVFFCCFLASCSAKNGFKNSDLENLSDTKSQITIPQASAQTPQSLNTIHSYIQSNTTELYNKIVSSVALSGDILTITFADSTTKTADISAIKSGLVIGNITVYSQDSQPGSCSVGDFWFDTNATVGKNFFGCTSTDTFTLQSGAGLSEQPTGTEQVLVSTGSGEGQYTWSTYDTLKTALGVPVVGIDFYSPEAVDALLTPTSIADKLSGQAISPSNIEIAPGSTGPQVLDFGDDTDLSQNKFSLGAPSGLLSSYGIMFPTVPPLEGQTIKLHVPSQSTGNDGNVRNMARAYFEDPGAGTFVGLSDIVANSITINDVIATKGAKGNFQDQLDILNSGITGLVSPPDYRDTPCTKGSYAYSTDGLTKYECVDTDKWFTVALTDSLSGDPGGPVAQSLTISGTGPQYATIPYDRAVTATTTADLCDDWSVTMTNAGALTLGYAGGDTTDTIVCSIAEDVYNDDTVVSSSYTPGTIESVVGGVALAAIADFSSSTTNSSSESPPIAGCGASTTLVDEGWDGDFTGWVKSGVWYISSSYVWSNTATAPFIISTTSLDPECQWADANVIEGMNANVSNAGLVLRASGTTGNKYVIRIQWKDATTNTLYWMTYNGTTNLGVIQQQDIPAFSADTRIGAQVYGTDNDTVMNVYVNQTGAGPDEWGTPTYSFTNDPGAIAVNVGNYAGLWETDNTNPLVKYSYTKLGN